MKKFFTILFTATILLICTSCGKDSDNIDSENELQNKNNKELNESYENQDEMVEQFIQSLLDSTYKTSSIPYFNPEAIKALLNHADDYTPISYFPISIISSYDIIHKKLGECILWSIESVRIKYPLTDKNRFNQFVSSVPMLVEKKLLLEVKPGVDPLDYRINDEQLNEVYDAYKKWWSDYNHENFEEIRKINPLEDLEYMWY